MTAPATYPRSEGWAWKFTPRYSLMMGVQNTRIGSPAVNSPIVETRNAPIAYIGLGWNL